MTQLQPAPPATALQAALGAAFAEFGRPGASYPLFVEPPAGEELEIVSATDLLDPRNLRRYCERALLEWTDHPEDEDFRAAASRMLRRYCGSLALATLVPLAHGVAFDLSLPRVSFLIRTEMPMGVLLDPDRVMATRCEERPSDWPVDGPIVATTAALREVALRGALTGHLAPAFERVLAAVHVNPMMLWTTFAEQIDLAFTSLTSDDALIRARVAEDRAALLFDPILPGVEGPNPLLDLLAWERFDDPLLPEPLQVRKICCAQYVIPGRTQGYCRTCGIAPAEERHRLWRAWVTSLSPS